MLSDDRPDSATTGHAQAETTPLGHQGPEQISDQPLINTFHHWLVEILFVSFVLLLIYVSFVPFDFSAARGTVGGGSLWGLATQLFHPKDVLANIGLYAPLGALAFAVGRRRHLGRILSGILTLAFAAILSYGIERGQFYVISRVSSWPDVMSNILGAGLGMVLVGLCEGQIRRSVQHARRAVRTNWASALATLFICVVLLAHLRPYDGVVDMFHTAAQMRHADMSPMAQWYDLRNVVAEQVNVGRRGSMLELPRVRAEYVLDRTTDVAAYAAIAFLMAMGLRSQFRSRGNLYLWCGFVCVSLAAMVTVIRIFLISHGFDSAHFFCGVLAWPLGCLAAQILFATADRQQEPAAKDGAVNMLTLRDEHSTRQQGPAARFATAYAPAPVLPIGWKYMAMAMVFGLVMLYELVPFDFGSSAKIEGAPESQFCKIPFLWHFRSRPNDALYDITGEILRYGAAAVCLAFALRWRSRRPWKQQLWATVLAIGVLATCLEGLHLFMPSRHTDVTTILLAMIGAFGGSVIVKWMCDFQGHISATLSDDLLTGQLIEGETYKPLPTTESREAKKATKQETRKPKA